jgi:hypothetical protein
VAGRVCCEDAPRARGRCCARGDGGDAKMSGSGKQGPGHRPASCAALVRMHAASPARPANAEEEAEGPRFPACLMYVTSSPGLSSAA